MMMTQPLRVGTVLKNQYRIVRLVGGGGMAWVYQVEELSPAPSGPDPGRHDNGQLWALKELRPQTEDQTEQAAARALFDQEARLLRALSHPNIPAIADFFEEGGRACLVMEFIWGESLEKRLEAANAPLLEADVLHWAVQLCDALDYLHSRQPPIIFRDMKPSNVMVTNTGQVKLIDFGIARTYKAGKKRDTVAMGSENYAAPEQWGKGQTDARSDVYALGATLYHLLANMAPTPAFLPSEPLPLKNYNGALSKATVTLIERAMARQRERRFQSAQEMRQALIDALPAPYVASAAAAPSPPALQRQQPTPEAPQVVAPARPVPPGSPKEQADGELQRGHDSVQDVPPVAPESLRHETESSLANADRGRPSQHRLAGGVHRGDGDRQHPQARAAPPTPKVKACPSCARSNKEGARFCVACGYAFGPVRPAILRVVEPVRAAWEMPVSRSPMLLGRSSEVEGYWPDFDMTFYDEGDFVSRRHARITKGRGGYFLVDLGSSNGTTVNGQRLIPQCARLLRNGDRIKVGLVVIQFRLR